VQRLVSLIIPAFNEEGIIKNSIERVKSYFEKSRYNYEIIVVDDGSRDKTSDISLQMRVATIVLPRNSGKGAAIKEGAAMAKGDYIFFTDADLPYSLDFFKEALKMLKSNDIVCGKRVGRYPVLRNAGSAAYNNFAKRLLKIKTEDIQCGIKGFTKNVAKIILPLCKVNGFAIDTEIIFLACQMGYSIKSLSAEINHRKRTKVNLLTDSIKMLCDIIKIRNDFEAGDYNFLESYQR